MEFIRFIFSSSWVWMGFIVLVLSVAGAAAEIIKAAKQNRKVAVYRVGDVKRVEIENATRGDVTAALRKDKNERDNHPAEDDA